MFEAEIAKVPASWVETAVAHPEKENGKVTSSSVVNGLANGHSHSPKGHPALSEDFLEGKAVRTFYGPVPLKYALDWPVFASYDELSGCAAWMGGRIPTFEEARSIYNHVELQKRKRKEAESQLGKTVPAVNG